MMSMFSPWNFLPRMRQLKIKAVSRFASLLVTFLLATTSVHGGAVYSFAFQNVEGVTAGTVSGTITLSGTGDGNFNATSITIDSAPVAFGYTSPHEVSVCPLYIVTDSLL
jgi:hypothetical protein